MNAAERDELLRQIAFLTQRKSSLETTVRDLSESKTLLDAEILERRATIANLVETEMVVIKDLLDRFKGMIKAE